MTPTCRCGNAITDRHTHRVLYGHSPTPETDQPAPVPQHKTSACWRKKHKECGGGVIGGLRCACTCGHEGAWA